MDGFKAFLSYSHKDDEVVSWFHRNLERWKIDRDLVGRETVHGVIPASLSPVFRDRDDFAGGHSLVDATLDALRSSEFLIVFCSPNSAKSEYVNEEVRLFKAMGSPEKVIPVIIAGEPGDPDDECFPPAVKYQVSPDGEILDAIEQPIAPDAREAGDGRKRALAKLVAGILGLSFDEIIRREMRQRRNRNAVLAGSAIGAFVFATAFGSYALYRNYQASITINKSVFAIGGLIQEADKMEGEEMEVSRTEMLRSLCDLIDGLSPDPEDIGKIERSICLCERALARSGVGEVEEALEDLGRWKKRLNGEFQAAERPGFELCTALVRVAYGEAGLLVGRSAADEESSRIVLDLLELSEEVSRARPDIAYVGEIHRESLWVLVTHHQSEENFGGALELLENALEIRELQTGASAKEEVSWVLIEDHGAMLSRAMFLCDELEDQGAALDFSRRAAVVLDQLPGEVRFAVQVASANEALAARLFVTPEKEQSAVCWLRAKDILESGIAQLDEDDGQREEFQEMIDYLDQQLQAAGE